eukprot:5355270-Pleurochrysis_carterae.AAC.2
MGVCPHVRRCHPSRSARARPTTGACSTLVLRRPRASLCSVGCCPRVGVPCPWTAGSSGRATSSSR